ncbi:MAG: regulatory protein RecX [Clostridiales bacterium]|nr:regulatory protein RecX [Clostridiales bacterium]
MKILSVEKPDNNTENCVIRIEGHEDLVILAETYIKLCLYEKEDINEEEFDAILKAAQKEKARTSATTLLSTRLRSSGEIRERLLLEGFKEMTIEDVVNDLVDIGYINDRLFAAKYVHDRNRSKPRPQKILKQELMAKGVDDEAIEEALYDYKQDDQMTAHSLVKRKYGKYDSTDEKILRRIFYFLRSRGYDENTIEAVVNEIKNGDPI